MRRTLEPLHSGSATQLRRELSARNLQRATAHEHETTYGNTPAVLYQADGDAHGNFYPPAYRSILRNEEWRERLGKAYTASNRIARSHDRQRFELDCCNSSDALLMSIFCHAPVRRSPKLRALLGISAEKPEFGARAHVPLLKDLLDRTEIDLVLREGDDTLLVEAKLTESGFQRARPALLERYPTFEQVFLRDALPRSGSDFAAYQLIRCTLAADHHDAGFAVLVDARRPDLQETTFRVFAAVQSSQLRSRLHLYTWQEIAACVPRPLQRFLADKYGIHVPLRQSDA